MLVSNAPYLSTRGDPVVSARAKDGGADSGFAGQSAVSRSNETCGLLMPGEHQLD